MRDSEDLNQGSSKNRDDDEIPETLLLWTREDLVPGWEMRKRGRLRMTPQFLNKEIWVDGDSMNQN